MCCCDSQNASEQICLGWVDKTLSFRVASGLVFGSLLWLKRRHPCLYCTESYEQCSLVSLLENESLRYQGQYNFFISFGVFYCLLD